MLFPLTSKLKPSALLLVLMLLLVPALASCSKSQNSGGGATAAADAENAVQIGVLVALDGTDKTRERYQPLFDELSEAVDQPVRFVPLTQRSQFSYTEAGRVDFVITQPLVSLQLRRQYDTELIATLSRPNTGTEFGGVIVVKADSPIQTSTDLAGKKGACVSTTQAAGGCLFQMYHLRQEGINPLIDLTISEVPSQDTIVQQVVDGEAEFGFVRTGHIEKMVEQGLLADGSAVRILDPITDGYPVPHTTQLYPEWAVSATADVPAGLVNKMQQAMLNIPAGDEALASAKIEQIVPTVDYSKLDALIDDLNLMARSDS